MGKFNTFLCFRRNEIWVQDTTFVASDEAGAVAVRGDEEAVAEPEHVLPEEDLSVDAVAEVYREKDSVRRDR